MSLPDSFLKGRSREAITVITFLGYQAGCFTVEEIQEHLPWMKPEKVKSAVQECIDQRLVCTARGDAGEARYFID